MTFFVCWLSAARCSLVHEVSTPTHLNFCKTKKLKSEKMCRSPPPPLISVFRTCATFEAGGGNMRGIRNINKPWLFFRYHHTKIDMMTTAATKSTTTGTTIPETCESIYKSNPLFLILQHTTFTFFIFTLSKSMQVQSLKYPSNLETWLDSLGPVLNLFYF